MMREYDSTNGHRGARWRDDDDGYDRMRERDDYGRRDRRAMMHDPREDRWEHEDPPGERAEYRPRMMGNSLASVWEVTAQSRHSFDDAIRYGIDRARRTLRHIRGAWVQGQEVMLRNGEIYAFRVQLKITYVLDDR